jgi:hypothetical protein
MPAWMADAHLLGCPRSADARSYGSPGTRLCTLWGLHWCALAVLPVVLEPAFDV